MHTPVLLKEVIEALEVKPGGLYIDATAGEGGHTEELLKYGAKVLAIDRDKEQITNLKKKLNNTHLTFAVGDFAEVEAIAKKHSFYPADGILFDLGLSMAQLAQSGRGFSYKYDEEPLDMRLDTKEEETAEYVLNTYSEEQLYDLLARYGEDIHSETLARTIVHTRVKHRFKTVGDLVTVINEVLTGCKQGHYHNFNQSASRIFQAIRMKVNHEVDSLKQGLEGAVSTIKDDGKIAVITFHSIEDRIVKQFIRERQLQSLYEIKNNKSSENRHKSFERSAKLRVFTKKT